MSDTNLYNERQSRSTAEASDFPERNVMAPVGDEPKLFPEEDDSFTRGWLQNRWSEMDNERPDEEWELRYDQYESQIEWNDDGTANINLPIERSQIRLIIADEAAQTPVVRLHATERDDVYKTSLLREINDFVWTEANTDENLEKFRYREASTLHLCIRSLWGGETSRIKGIESQYANKTGLL